MPEDGLTNIRRSPRRGCRSANAQSRSPDTSDIFCSDSPIVLPIVYELVLRGSGEEADLNLVGDLVVEFAVLAGN